MLWSGGVEVTGAGEQETGGGQQAAESCYRGGQETEWSPGEISQTGSGAQVTLAAGWLESQEKHLILSWKL